uniref:Vacuolar protein sorting-associated protein 16 homolog n=1 Tax=Arcella intermedia TaxID=1963864 RepID=A0A6B2KY24_9EUKA
MTKEWSNLKEFGQNCLDRFTIYQDSAFENVKDFRTVKFYASPFGGPIAFLNTELLTNESIAPLEIYRADGKQRLGVLNVMDIYQDIIEIGWNDLEELIIVLKNGTFLLYDMYGKVKQRVSVSDSLKTETVEQARIVGPVVAFQTKKSFYLLDDRRPLASPKETVYSWLVIPPELSPDNHTELIYSDSSALHAISTARNTDPVALPREGGGYKLMALSPSGKLLACYSRDHRIHVVQSDFSKELLEVNTGIEDNCYPDQFVWCGESGVCCYYRELSVLLVVGLSGECVVYPESEAINIVSECDGLRIYTTDSCEFLHVASDSLKRIFDKDNDKYAPATLYRAAYLFHKNKTCVDEIILELKKSLAQAIDVLIDAATHEWDIPLQKELLRAAAFGITYLEKQVIRFYETGKWLRVLNAMRKFGIPLTFTQLRVMTPEVLIERLMNRNIEASTVDDISQYLGLKGEQVLIRWSKSKVSDFSFQETEDKIANSIKYKLRSSTGVSFASIAYEAYKIGREELAIMLLDAEPRPADQVPLLVHMRRYEIALEKAVDSGDTNLIHMVLAIFRINIENGTSSAIDFETIVRQSVPARAVWAQMCKQTNLEMLIKMYSKEKLPMEVARLEIQKIINTNNLELMENRMKYIADILKKSALYPMESTLTENEIDLLKLQVQLEESFKVKFVGSSLTNTIYRVLLLGSIKKAKKIRSDFKVPNKRWWWIKIGALAETGRWEALRSFSTKRHSPIGYRPFVEVCIKNGNASEAKHYMRYMDNCEAKVLYYLKLQAWYEAVETADTLELPEFVYQQMLNKIRDSTLKSKVKSQMARYYDTA